MQNEFISLIALDVFHNSRSRPSAHENAANAITTTITKAATLATAAATAIAIQANERSKRAHYK